LDLLSEPLSPLASNSVDFVNAEIHDILQSLNLTLECRDFSRGVLRKC
jgi:DNA phosphorothioation-dependent restriction protein DptG